MKKIIFLLLIFFCGTLYAEDINDVFTKVVNSNEAKFIDYLIEKGFERYNLQETNGNLYFQPKKGMDITFFGMKMNVVIVGYYKSKENFTLLNISVKSKNNVEVGRETVRRIAEMYDFKYNGNVYKNGSYNFSYDEYLDDVYGYLSYSFSNWTR